MRPAASSESVSSTRELARVLRAHLAAHNTRVALLAALTLIAAGALWYLLYLGANWIALLFVTAVEGTEARLPTVVENAFWFGAAALLALAWIDRHLRPDDRPKDHKTITENVLEVAQSVATLAGASLGEEYARFRDYHGFTRCHVRELALYRDSDPRLRRHSPALLALSPAGDTERLTLVLDELPASSLFHAGKTDAAWKPDLLHAAIDGAAEIHSVWYRREAELMAMPWLAPVRESRRLTEMRPLWSALADHARAHSPAWSNATLVRIHRRLVECVAEWSVPLTSLPRTLIHNDFNPRNIAIVPEGEPRLCAFDWELATIGVPQRDIAELLCWTIDETTTREEIAGYLERSRLRLASSTGMHIDRHDWELGFSAALCELLVERLAMYAMVDRFRPQGYLPRVVRGWLILERYYPWSRK